MRILRIALLISFIISFSVPATAFYSHGRINKDVSYSNIELIKQSVTIRVTGTLQNKTRQPIRFNGKIMFVTIHDEVLNSATIIETIPANGSVGFDNYLDKNNYDKIKHAYKIKWSVRNYSSTGNSPKSSRKESKRESIGYSHTRSSDSYVSVSGKGNHNSDQFKMKTGLYIAKVSHTGKYHCGIKLLHSDGTHAELITNEIGYVKESNTVRIDKDGYYLLDVSADGDWSVKMEYQAPKTIKQDATSQQVATPEASERGVSTTPVVIKLKNGRTMKAQSYWEEGDKLKVSIYGGIMVVDKKDVQEIVAP